MSCSNVSNWLVSQAYVKNYIEVESGPAPPDDARGWTEQTECEKESSRALPCDGATGCRAVRPKGMKVTSIKKTEWDLAKDAEDIVVDETREDWREDGSTAKAKPSPAIRRERRTGPASSGGINCLAIVPL
jgi:hypothetical protein